ncbi:MAG: hypothetical protein KGH72_02160 [Candidatus Micrarchaeota archaeon]|nr:hypothetical protein [Candidatus Micrarchaeota archaeon]
MIKDIPRIEKKLVSLENRRDEIMRLSRENIRICGKAISMMHARQMPAAKRMIAQLKAGIVRIKRLEPGFEYYTLQAHQEYTEAVMLFSVLAHGRIATMGEVGSGEPAYLLGMMDVVGELKREALDAMRRNEMRKAAHYYDIMLDIYDSTLHMRFANSLLPDFRKKQDVARIQVEGLANELSRLQSGDSRGHAASNI